MWGDHIAMIMNTRTNIEAVDQKPVNTNFKSILHTFGEAGMVKFVLTGNADGATRNWPVPFPLTLAS
jgi:hypothetical protein